MSTKLMFGAVGVVVLLGGIWLSTGDDMSTEANDSSDSSVSTFNDTDLKNFLGYDGETAPMLEFKDLLPGEPFGALGGTTATANGVFAAAIEFDEEEVQSFNRYTNLDLMPGRYSLMMLNTDLASQSESDRNNTEFGLGILKHASNAVGDPDAVEPIPHDANDIALFANRKTGWARTALFDVQDSFAVIDGEAGTYIDTSNNIVAFLFPQNIAGDSPTYTFQSFLRNTPDGQQASGDDPIGGTGHWIMDLPTPNLESEIFADGFESGDTSAWGN